MLINKKNVIIKLLKASLFLSFYLKLGHNFVLTSEKVTHILFSLQRLQSINKEHKKQLH